jgi:hypothetical protein
MLPAHAACVDPFARRKESVGVEAVWRVEHRRQSVAGGDRQKDLGAGGQEPPAELEVGQHVER